MRLSRIASVCLLLACIVSGALAATVVQERKANERKVKKVTRVKRPKFTPRDSDGIYFNNLFVEGLVGPRPQPATPGGDSSKTSKTTGQLAGVGNANNTTKFAWSKNIDRGTLEDEVKSLQKLLSTDITTPIKFKSDYGKVHHSFAMLSMVFAIVREYDDEVRWKKFAGEAQASFERAAANSRVGTIQAYESCKRRKGDLEEMVRGGNFASDDKAPETLDWSTVVERSPIMDRLDESRTRLKQLTSSKGEFSKGIDKVTHEAQLVAAIAMVLTRENMTDADDDGYVEYAMAMNKAALEIRDACRNQDYELASRAANTVIQSCDDCHGEWN